MYFLELGFTKDFAGISILESGSTKDVKEIYVRELGLINQGFHENCFSRNRLNQRYLENQLSRIGLGITGIGLPRISRKSIFVNATPTGKPRKGSRHWLSEKVVRCREVYVIERCPL